MNAYTSIYPPKINKQEVDIQLGIYTTPSKILYNYIYQRSPLEEASISVLLESFLELESEDEAIAATPDGPGLSTCLTSTLTAEKAVEDKLSPAEATRSATEALQGW